MATETLTTDQLLSAVLKLPVEARLEFAEALSASLTPKDAAFLDESWKRVICQRDAEFESGADVPIPWEEVKRKAREALGG